MKPDVYVPTGLSSWEATLLYLFKCIKHIWFYPLSYITLCASEINICSVCLYYHIMFYLSNISRRNKHRWHQQDKESKNKPHNINTCCIECHVLGKRGTQYFIYNFIVQSLSPLQTEVSVCHTETYENTGTKPAGISCGNQVLLLLSVVGSLSCM